MAKVNKIFLNNFRNFRKYETTFNNSLNIFYGNNGSGKTNILESISLISKGRGIRNASISDLITHSEKNFLIKSLIEINKTVYEVEVKSFKNNDRLKKITNLNDDSSKDSINFLNSSISHLVFLPEMERLFLSSPSYRRNFIDRLIFSEKNNYNKTINKYKKFLTERAKFLQQNQTDMDWINYIEAQISEHALKIYELRNSQLKIINTQIDQLNKSNEFPFNINLQINDNFLTDNISYDHYINELKSIREFDKKYGGSKIGPHKSDIYATINQSYDASLLSTGQQKTVVLMILLAQCNHLVNFKNIEPILLLDEICSHLDSNNRQILLKLIHRFNTQLFLTGTDKSLFSFISTNANFYNIKDL